MKRVLAACGLWLVAGCLTERPRPAPPTLALSLNKTTVRSRSNPAPDTLVVNVRAEDEDGIDSVWVQLAQEAPVGADGLLDPVLEGPFRIVVPAGCRIAFTIRGKDYEHQREAASLSNMKNPMRGCGPFVHDDPTDRPPAIFGGEITLHFGATRQAGVLLPVIPPK